MITSSDVCEHPQRSFSGIESRRVYSQDDAFIQPSIRRSADSVMALRKAKSFRTFKSSSRRAVEADNGSVYRFQFPGHLPICGHMDVYCSWDKGNPELETNEMGENMKYMHRLRFVKLAARNGMENPVTKAMTYFEKIVESKLVDIEQLSKFVVTMEPYSVSDMKPLLVLCQGLLMSLVRKELTFLNSRLTKRADALESELQAAYNEINRLREQEKAMEHKISVLVVKNNELSQQRTTKDRRRRCSIKNVTRVVQAGQVIMQTSGSHDTETNECSRLNSVTEGSTEDKNDWDDLEEELTLERTRSQAMHNINQSNIQRLQSKLDEANKLLKVEQMKRESEQMEATFQINTMRARIANLKDMQEKQANADAESLRHAKIQLETEKNAHREREFELHQQTAERESQTAYLKARLEQIGLEDLRGEKRIDFLPWMHYQPLVEVEWAAKIVQGMATFAVPAGTVITLPCDADARTPMHVVDVPSGSEVEIPAGPGQVQLPIPPFSKVVFPDKVAGQLVLPGGASVILPHPDEGVSEFEVQLSPGCAIYPGAAEPVSFTGKTDDDEDESNTEKQVQVIICPRGGLSTHILPAGSTVIMPFGGISSTVIVPSMITLMIPTGALKFATLPEGSTILLNHQMGQHKEVTAMVLDGTIIRLPPPDAVAFSKEQSSVMNPCIYHVYIPYGSKLELPKGRGLIETTLEPGTLINTPKDVVPGEDGLLESCCVTPGGKKTMDSVIPETVKVMGGSILTLPQAIDVEPENVAKRMKALGSEAVGAAIGGMNPHQAAESMKLLSPKYVASILRLARPQAAGKVLRLMSPGHFMAEMLLNLPASVAGAILAQIDSSVLSDMLSESFNRDMRQYQGMLVKKECWAHSNDMLHNPSVTVRQLVDLVQQMDPEVSARLLAVTGAVRSSFIMMRLAARSSKQASQQMEALTEMSFMMSALGTRYKEEDTRRAVLQSRIAKAVSEHAMTIQLKALVAMLKEDYGIACTVCQLSPAQQSLEAENQEQDTTAWSQEQSAMDRLDFITTTEDAHWSFLAPKVDPASTQKLCLTVNMSAAILVEAMEEAFETKQMVFRGLYLVVPVCPQYGGGPWGAIIHINKNKAARHIMGNIFRKSKKNGLPKSIECLDAMAKSIVLSLDRIHKYMKVENEELEDNAMASAMEAVDRGEDLDDRELTIRCLSVHLARVSSIRNQNILEFLKMTPAAAHQVMFEIKEYKSPPSVLIKVMIALFEALDITGIADLLGEDLLNIPAADSPEERDVWEWVRKHIVLNSMHPLFFMRLLKEASKGLRIFNKPEKQLKKIHVGLSAILKDTIGVDIAGSNTTIAQIHAIVLSTTKKIQFTLHLNKYAASKVL